MAGEKEVLEELAKQSQAVLPLIHPIDPEYRPMFIPLQISYGTGYVNGKPCIVQQIADASGVKMSFLPIEFAKRCVENLDKTIRLAETGVIAAPPRHLKMNADGGAFGANGSPIGKRGR
jgi:hypothetical protein